MSDADHAFGSGESVLETERLVIRRWRPEDLEPFAAVQAPDGRFAGFVGLGAHPRRPDDVEVGWRLARWAWGRRYATEAARAWVAAAPGFGLTQMVSYVDPLNEASVAVTRRLGLSEDHREVWDGQTVAIFVLDLAP